MKLTRLALAAPALGLAIAAFVPPSWAQPKPTPACIRSRGEARARAVGYDHVVTIENGCDRAAACAVSTDVAPEPIHATVEAKQTVELTTFRNSPASVFKPRVECALK